MSDTRFTLSPVLPLLLVVVGCRAMQAVATSMTALAADVEPDWSADARLPPSGQRSNVYTLPAEEWAQAKREGVKYALSYPVAPTGLLIPYQPFQRLLEGEGQGRFAGLIGNGSLLFSGARSMDDVYAWMGLQAYPDTDGRDGFPFPDGGQRPNYRMGVSHMRRGGAEGLTFGCANCHVGQLFGRPVFGMTTRFPRANQAFFEAKTVLSTITPTLFTWLAKATPEEAQMLCDTNSRLRWVAAKKPAAMGLDSSLAQVALSLARREEDAYATMTVRSARSPRPNALETHVADSKPSVWWTLKYKTRWLTDGSVISGNPVHTNILWNEIGRATDLRELETWLDENKKIVRDLTAAVFATEPPLYVDYFPAESLHLEQAKRGGMLFNQHCSSCHGVYEKGWDAPDAGMRSRRELLATTHVAYPEQTFTVDVGTDPGRFRGMAEFADRLNELAISQAIGAVIQVQQGYVPPPLTGIWARWPYFHNNSVPSLYAVLTRGDQRPTTFYGGQPLNSETDFDRLRNGYPLAEAAPRAWKEEGRFDTRRPGLSNRGHDEGIFLKNGCELLTPDEKLDLIEYLKTL